MKIVIGSDHGGFSGKDFVKKWLQKAGHDVTDFGCHSTDPVDYPDIAQLVAEAVVAKQFDKGVLLDGFSGADIKYLCDRAATVPFLESVATGKEDEITAEILRDTIRQMGERLSGLGYVVLQPEYRGSTGCGSDFLNAIYQHFGDRAYEDVDSATDYAIAQGWADPHKLAIFGWSAGGFMTSWTVTQTNRYRAAIEGAGITDWLSFIPTSDIAQVEYFILLAERGKTVKMVTYPGSPHFPLRWEQRRDIFEQINSWLAKYNP